METYRLFFSKRGRTRFISHLDMTRVFSRALRKSGIPIWYTEGFNQHIYMNFMLPLSLGIESVCEMADIRVVEEYSANEIYERLRGLFPEGLEVYNCALPVMKQTEIAFAGYIFDIDSDSDLPGVLKSFETEPAIVRKRSKSGEKDVDIAKDIVTQSCERRSGGYTAEIILPAGAKYSVTPSLVCTALRQRADIADCRITRVGVFDESLKKFQ